MNNKTENVRKHLEELGSITSWEAITLHRATRLSAIIFNLKHRDGMNIQTQLLRTKDNEPYAKYVLVKE